MSSHDTKLNAPSALDRASLSTVTKPANFFDLGLQDTTSLNKFVSKLSATVWQIENSVKENNFSVFHHTEHIIFRFIPNFGDPRDFYSNPIWHIAEPHVRPLMEKIAAHYKLAQPEFSKVMLARLQAGFDIAPHRDGAGSNLLCHKIHVPIVTDTSVTMTVGGVCKHLEVNRAYEVNNTTLHSVSNPSETDRVHLIFELFDNRENQSSF